MKIQNEEINNQENRIVNDFSRGSLLHHMLRMSLPIMFAQAAGILYNFVDRMFIGRIEDIGHLALGGVGIVFPIIMILTAVANMFGVGGSALYAIERGKKDFERAEKIMGNAFSMLVISGVILPLIFYVFRADLLYLVGASENTYIYAERYLSIYLAGSVFQMISLGMNSYINAQGFAKTGMVTVLTGAVVNIILDPVFIFYFDMGVSGAAVATVISQLVSCLWVMKFFMGKKTISRLTRSTLNISGSILWSIFKLGIANFMGIFTTAVITLLSNALLESMGGDIFVSSMTVINSLREALTLVVMGLVNGAGPVLGYNYGARLYSRVTKGIRIMVIMCMSVGIAVWAAAMLLPEQLILIFNDDPQLLEVGTKAVRMYFFAFFMISLQAAGQNCYLSLGKSGYALFFSLFRKFILALPLLLIVPNLWGLGAYGVFAVEPITDILAGLLNITVLYFAICKKLRRCTDGEPV